MSPTKKDSSAEVSVPVEPKASAPGATHESWIVVGDDPANLHVVQADQPHMRVCFMTSDGPTERRARLIASAPDLLAELKSMTLLFRSAPLCTTVEIAREARPFLDKADAAITKAEGR